METHNEEETHYWVHQHSSRQRSRRKYVGPFERPPRCPRNSQVSFRPLTRGAAPALSLDTPRVTICSHRAMSVAVAMNVVVASCQQGVRCGSSTFLAPLLCHVFSMTLMPTDKESVAHTYLPALPRAQHSSCCVLPPVLARLAPGGIASANLETSSFDFASAMKLLGSAGAEAS